MILYSFGCLIWELFGRRRPWCWLERTDIICLSQIRHTISLPLSPCWPEFIQEIVEQATRLNADARPSFQHLYDNVFRRYVDHIDDIGCVSDSHKSSSKNLRFSSNHITATGSTLSREGTQQSPRKSCLKMTSHSEGVMQRALPRAVHAHRPSRCICNNKGHCVDHQDGNNIASNNGRPKKSNVEIITGSTFNKITAPDNDAAMANRPQTWLSYRRFNKKAVLGRLTTAKEKLRPTQLQLQRFGRNLMYKVNERLVPTMWSPDTRTNTLKQPPVTIRLHSPQSTTNNHLHKEPSKYNQDYANLTVYPLKNKTNSRVTPVPVIQVPSGNLSREQVMNIETINSRLSTTGQGVGTFLGSD